MREAGEDRLMDAGGRVMSDGERWRCRWTANGLLIEWLDPEASADDPGRWIEYGVDPDVPEGMDERDLRGVVEGCINHIKMLTP